MNNDTVAEITISGMELKTYNETFNNINGIGLSSSGTLSIYQNGGGRDEFAYWFISEFNNDDRKDDKRC